MDTFADLVSTRKVPHFRIPPEAIPEGARASRRQGTPRSVRIFAALAIAALMAVAILIAEPWDTMRHLLVR